MNSLALARDMIARGFQPVPVKPRDKRPVYDDWQNQRYTESDLPRVFRDGENVGILLGEASDKTIDIDIDHPRGAAALRALGAPKTLSYHRGGRPHLLVRCDPVPKTTKLAATRDGKPVMFCEVRSNGCQSVAPGSIHPDGDAYEWLNDEPRAGWEPWQALNFARDIATVCLLADHWKAPNRGESGARHQMALAVAGFLARRTTDEQAVMDIVEAAASISGDTEIYDRRRAVQDTLGKINRGVAVVGLPTLAELIGDDDAKALVKWWPDNYETLVAPPAASQFTAEDASAFDVNGDEDSSDAWDFTVYEITEFLSMEFPKQEWIIGGMLRERGIAIDFGPPGSMKTILAAQLGTSVATGRPFLGQFPVKQGKVLIVQEDTLESDFQGYLKAIYQAMEITPEEIVGQLYVAPPCDMKLDQPQRLAKLAAWIEKFRPTLVIMDAFYLLHDTDGMTPKELRPVLTAIKRLRRMYDVAIWILDHDRKSGKEANTEGNAVDKLYGGRPKSAAVDSIIESMPVKGDKAAVFIQVHKVRGARPPDPIRLRIEDGLLVAESGTVESASGATQTAWQWLIKEGGSRTKRQIATGTQLSSRSVETALGELTIRGLAKEAAKTGREKTWIGLREPDKASKGFVLGV